MDLIGVLLYVLDRHRLGPISVVLRSLPLLVHLDLIPFLERLHLRVVCLFDILQVLGQVGGRLVPVGRLVGVIERVTVVDVADVGKRLRVARHLVGVLGEQGAVFKVLDRVVGFFRLDLQSVRIGPPVGLSEYVLVAVNLLLQVLLHGSYSAFGRFVIMCPVWRNMVDFVVKRLAKGGFGKRLFGHLIVELHALFLEVL